MSLSSLFCTTAVVLASTVALSYLFVFRIFRIVLRTLGEHLRRRTANKRELVLSELAEGKGILVGFFHPFWYVPLSGGGGGEGGKGGGADRKQ